MEGMLDQFLHSALGIAYCLIVRLLGPLSAGEKFNQHKRFPWILSPFPSFQIPRTISLTFQVLFIFPSLYVRIYSQTGPAGTTHQRAGSEEKPRFTKTFLAVGASSWTLEHPSCPLPGPSLRMLKRTEDDIREAGLSEYTSPTAWTLQHGHYSMDTSGPTMPSSL